MATPATAPGNHLPAHPRGDDLVQGELLVGREGRQGGRGARLRGAVLRLRVGRGSRQECRGDTGATGKHRAPRRGAGASDVTCVRHERRVSFRNRAGVDCRAAGAACVRANSTRVARAVNPRTRRWTAISPPAFSTRWGVTGTKRPDRGRAAAVGVSEPVSGPTNGNDVCGTGFGIGDCAQASQGRNGQLGIRNTIVFGTEVVLSILLLSDRRVSER